MYLSTLWIEPEELLVDRAGARAVPSGAVVIREIQVDIDGALERAAPEMKLGQLKPSSDILRPALNDALIRSRCALVLTSLDGSERLVYQLFAIERHRPSPRERGAASPTPQGGHLLTRVLYSPVRVSTLIHSPSSTKRGT